MTTPATIERTCEHCGQQFSYERPRTAGRQRKWCSEACKRAATNARSRAEYAEANPGHVGEVSGTCEHCAQPFHYVKGRGPFRRYCSRRCCMLAGLESANQKAPPIRVCACGSTNVGPTNKPVCPDCLKDKRTTRNLREDERRFALYGITAERFAEMLADQRGLCPICTTGDPGPRGWFIDHDHQCCAGIGSCGNCVRGLLCADCNFLLGNAKDSIELLDRARKYLVSNSQFKLKLQVVGTHA